MGLKKPSSIYDTKTFGTTLRELRKKRGLSRKQLSEELNIPEETLRNWEKGKTFIGLEYLNLLCSYFECSFDHLFGKITCKTHDVQDIADYTGLSETSIDVLHESIKDPARCMAIDFFLSDKILLHKIVKYFCSHMCSEISDGSIFSGINKSNLFLHDCKQRNIYADVLEELPKAQSRFKEQFGSDIDKKRLAHYLMFNHLSIEDVVENFEYSEYVLRNQERGDLYTDPTTGESCFYPYSDSELSCAMETYRDTLELLSIGRLAPPQEDLKLYNDFLSKYKDKIEEIGYKFNGVEA